MQQWSSLILNCALHLHIRVPKWVVVETLTDSPITTMLTQAPSRKTHLSRQLNQQYVSRGGRPMIQEEIKKYARKSRKTTINMYGHIFVNQHNCIYVCTHYANHGRYLCYTPLCMHVYVGKSTEPLWPTACRCQVTGLSLLPRWSMHLSLAYVTPYIWVTW